MPRKIAKSMPGYYSPGETMARMGVTDRDAFHALVRKYRKDGILTPYKPLGVTLFPVAQINTITAALVERDLTIIKQSERPLPTTFAQATVYDIPGVTDVLKSHGWPYTPVDLREKWYRVNDRIDYIVRYGSLILGYANIMTYTPGILEEMMSGRMRGWDVRPEHLLPFEPYHTYDCFTGVATRDVPHGPHYGKRLITGFFHALCQLAESEHIIIKHLYATSSEEDGEKLSNDLGFVKEPAHSGDLFGRYVLDMQTGTHPLVQAYREIAFAQEDSPS